MNDVLNLVFDTWIDEKPVFNGKIKYPKNHFWDIEDFVKSYVNSFSDTGDEIKVNTCKITEVYENTNQKYYYFICHATINLDEIIKDDLIISNEIKECLKLCDNFNIVFFSHHESDSENGFKILNNSDLPKNQIYIINNNYKLNEYVNVHNSKIKIYSVMYLPIVVSLSLQRDEGTEFNTDDKEKFFMCFNRGPKIQRYSLLAFMLKNNLLDDTNWSFIPLGSVDYSYENYDEIFEDGDIKNYEDEIKILSNLKLKISDYEKTELSFDDNNEITILNPRYINTLSPPDMPLNYKNSYVNIVTETKFLDKENVIQISEKSFKPFFYYQFPIILATHHHMKSLKEKYDFDLFDDVIDHSYDNEPDQKKRLFMVLDEIKRLNDNKDKLIEFYKNNTKRFEDNKNRIYKLLFDKKDFIFFKNLI